MTTVFKYKQKLIPKVLMLFIMVISPLIMNRPYLYLSVSYYLTIIISQIIIYAYYSSKRLIISETGIEEVIFCKFLWNLTEWGEMGRSLYNFS